jgi:hypothetical protein
VASFPVEIGGVVYQNLNSLVLAGKSNQQL